MRTGHLFCYVAKVSDGTRWCRVFRCEDAMLLRESAADVIKDALMTVRYVALPPPLFVNDSVFLCNISHHNTRFFT